MQQFYRMLGRGVFDPFIKYIRFPHYKNLAENTKIEFNFPITALVGANGTNKSSILKALYGAPGMNNLGNLWFSTEIDPIVEGEDRPNCFIYGFYNQLARQDVEVLKTRVRKVNDPDYWEPSRPIVRYGMQRLEPMPREDAARLGRSGTRWNTISKNVVYFDFRSELSAFDKYFYHERVVKDVANQKQRKDFIRKRSGSLKKCIEAGTLNFSLGRVQRIFNNENFTLSAAEIESVSKILGRNYSTIKLIRHGFFESPRLL